MTLKFGFELEGFVWKKVAEGKNEIVPPSEINPSLPIDGFPGLLELRTVGGKSLEEAYSEIIKNLLSIDLKGCSYDFNQFKHTFTSEQFTWMKKKGLIQKRPVDIQNVYGKKLRLLGNKTLASLQINISNEICPKGDVTIVNAHGTQGTYPRPPSYGLLDITTIVKNLDKEFAHEIQLTKRQPGMYAIKDGIRLEYRSLPNCSFPFNQDEAYRFISRIRKAVSCDS